MWSLLSSNNTTPSEMQPWACASTRSSQWQIWQLLFCSIFSSALSELWNRISRCLVSETASLRRSRACKYWTEISEVWASVISGGNRRPRIKEFHETLYDDTIIRQTALTIQVVQSMVVTSRHYVNQAKPVLTREEKKVMWGDEGVCRSSGPGLKSLSSLCGKKQRKKQEGKS